MRVSNFKLTHKRLVNILFWQNIEAYELISPKTKRNIRILDFPTRVLSGAQFTTDKHSSLGLLGISLSSHDTGDRSVIDDGIAYVDMNSAPITIRVLELDHSIQVVVVRLPKSSNPGRRGGRGATTALVSQLVEFEVN